MFLSLSNYLKKYPIGFSLLISFIIVFAVKFLFGFYYESYESFFTTLLSGVLTPGMVYDSLYHMSHLGGLAYLYAHLSSFFPNLPVINFIEYFIMISSLSILFYIYIVSANKIKWWYILLISTLSFEYFELLNCSRVSILACLSSCALLIYIIKNNKKIFSIEGLLMIIFWLIGLFTRVETALFILSVIVPLLLLIVYSEYQFKIKLKYYSIILFYVITVSLMSLYIILNSSTSDEFYLKIDPKYEAEIMFKQNVVPISKMENKIDSIRYKAIIYGFWGDAKLNDINFLESVVNNNKLGFFYLKSTTEYWSLIILFLKTYRLYLISYFLLSVFFIFGMKFRNFNFLLGLAAYQLFVLVLVVTIAVQVKFADRVTVSLLTGSLILQLLTITIFKKDKEVHLFSNLIFILLPVLAIGYHCHLLSKSYSKQIQLNKYEIESDNRIKNSKTLILSNESTDKILGMYRPFEEFTFFKDKRVFLLDNLALCTIEPYKTYLQKELKCNPDDYSELFIAVENYDAHALYLWEPERLEFLSYYLKEVHHLDLKSLSIQ